MKSGKKDKFFGAIPLIISIAMLLFCAFLVFEAFRYGGEKYDFDWIGKGGVLDIKNQTVFGIDFYWFIMSVGIVVTIISSLIRRKAAGYSIVLALFIPLFFFAESLAGAKVLFAIENAIGKGSFADLNFSGQSLFGSLYFTLPLIPILALITRKKTRDMYDFVAYFWLILLAFTRMGCVVAGCCGSKTFTVGDVPLRIQVQMIDAACALLLLCFCRRSQRDRANITLGYRPFNILLVGYSFCRLLLEFIRTNDVLFFHLTMSQYHCILFMIIGLILISHDRRKAII